MSSQKHRKLDAIVARLQLDYGPRALRRPEPDEKTPPVPRIPTSFSELDGVLGGGLPQGCITELTGPATSGKLTLTAKAIATAHSMDREVLAGWTDIGRTCDPDYMHRCGIDLRRLLVVHPATLSDALAALLHLAETNALALLAFDFGPYAGAVSSAAEEANFVSVLGRLTTTLSSSATAVVFLTGPKGQFRSLAHAAAIRVALRREQWITHNGDVRGYMAEAEVIKNRLGSTGARVPVRIAFNGTVRGNGL